MRKPQVFDPNVNGDDKVGPDTALEDLSLIGKPVASMTADGTLKFAMMRNPLLSLVDQLRQGKHYITQEIADRLLDLIPDNMRLAESINNTESSSLEVMLTKLARMATRLENATLGSDDTKELKDAFGALKDMITLVDKLKDDINTERHLRALEEATIGVFDDIGDMELKNKFVRLLELKLAGRA